MHDRLDIGIIIEGCDTKHDVRLIATLGNDVSAAHRTEAPHATGRGFEGRKSVPARDQMKMLPRDARRRC